MEVHCILWRKFDIVIEKKRLGMPISKGFMADGAQANWNVVCIVYGIRDPKVRWLTNSGLVFSIGISFSTSIRSS